MDRKDEEATAAFSQPCSKIYSSQSWAPRCNDTPQGRAENVASDDKMAPRCNNSPQGRAENVASAVAMVDSAGPHVLTARLRDEPKT